jgi:hypothetical protein
LCFAAFRNIGFFRRERVGSRRRALFSTTAAIVCPEDLPCYGNAALRCVTTSLPISKLEALASCGSVNQQIAAIFRLNSLKRQRKFL